MLHWDWESGKEGKPPAVTTLTRKANKELIRGVIDIMCQRADEGGWVMLVLELGVAAVQVL